jgi:hypothetical protein
MICNGVEKGARFELLSFAFNNAKVGSWRRKREKENEALSCVKMFPLFRIFHCGEQQNKRVQLLKLFSASLHPIHTSVCFFSAPMRVERRLEVGPAEAPWS